MLYALGVIFFAVGLLLSIALHEIGHLTPAKIFGVRVTQYMVGFGPTVWSRRKGETEYGVKAVPMGGYIRMIGMVPPAKSGTSRWPRRLAELVEEFRDASRTEVTDSDNGRQFYQLTPGKKMIIMLGGPCMNLLIFLVLTVLLYGLIGVKGPTTTIGSVSECLVPATSTATSCGADSKPVPAAGVLRAGDKILAINGTKISNWDDAVDIIEPSAGKKLSLEIRRDGQIENVTVTPVENTKYTGNGDQTKEAGFLGVSATEAYQRAGAGQLSSIVWSQLGLGIDALGRFPGKISNLVGTVFEGKPRDQNGAVGVVGLGRIGGQIADSSQIDLLDKVSSLLSLLASVNLLLFFFNLLPLLPLDGGHVAGAIVESVRRGWARLRARSRRRVLAGAATYDSDGSAAPHPEYSRPKIFVDIAQLVPVMYAVAAVLVVFSVLTLYADIVHPVTLQ